MTERVGGSLCILWIYGPLLMRISHVLLPDQSVERSHSVDFKWISNQESLDEEVGNCDGTPSLHIQASCSSSPIEVKCSSCYLNPVTSQPDGTTCASASMCRLNIFSRFFTPFIDLLGRAALIALCFCLVFRPLFHKSHAPMHFRCPTCFPSGVKTSTTGLGKPSSSEFSGLPPSCRPRITEGSSR